jgi:hypothetical protein
VARGGARSSEAPFDKRRDRTRASAHAASRARHSAPPVARGGARSSERAQRSAPGERLREPQRTKQAEQAIQHRQWLAAEPGAAKRPSTSSGTERAPFDKLRDRPRRPAPFDKLRDRPRQRPPLCELPSTHQPVAARGNPTGTQVDCARRASGSCLDDERRTEEAGRRGTSRPAGGDRSEEEDTTTRRRPEQRRRQGGMVPGARDTMNARRRSRQAFNREQGAAGTSPTA